MPVEPIILAHWHAADDRNAVVHRLAVQDLVIIPHLPEYPAREDVIRDLGFLKAEDVGRFFREESGNDVHAGPDAVDIP